MTATTASNLVERFDAGKDVLDYFDTENPLIVSPTLPSQNKFLLPSPFGWSIG